MIRAYHQPHALDEALGLIARGATAVAGATGLYTSKTKRVLDLVDLSRLGLGDVQVEADRMDLGAAVTFEQLLRANLPGIEGALLRQGCRCLASRPLREMVTVGGNIAHMVYWADLPVVLLALDATLEIQRAGQPAAKLSLKDCLETGQRSWQGGLITRVTVPAGRASSGFGHERLSKTSMDYSLVTACAVLRKDGDVARDVRVVLGAVQARAVRAEAVETALEGKHPEASLVREACDKLSRGLEVAPNYRAATDYRREMVAVLTRRAIESAWAMAAGH